MILSLQVRTNKKSENIYWDTLTNSNKERKLIVETKAKPIDGEANTAVVKQIANFLNVKRTLIIIKSGLRSKQKLVEIK